ncbi:hypothetical protein E1281_38075 [Actinomadura sp. KC345]|nr:hypothetical protein E1281_38075 [Actinomadura sp. KC345]
MGNRELGSPFSFWDVVALVVAPVVCAVVGAGIVVVVNGIVNVVNGFSFGLPYALAHQDVCVAIVLNLVVGGIVGGFCAFAVVDRIFASDLFVGTYTSCLLGVACASAMGLGGLSAWSRGNR